MHVFYYFYLLSIEFTKFIISYYSIYFLIIRFSFYAKHLKLVPVIAHSVRTEFSGA
jgi:hypothetical protein